MRQDSQGNVVLRFLIMSLTENGNDTGGRNMWHQLTVRNRRYRNVRMADFYVAKLLEFCISIMMESYVLTFDDR